MKNLQQLKAEKATKIDELITASSMFFAFSNEQFKENRTPLQDGENYVSLGAGAYIPKSKVNVYLDGIKSIDKWFKAELKSNKQRRENIVYELNNHEAFYTCEIEDTVSVLGNDYTTDEVQKVFNEELRKHELATN